VQRENQTVTTSYFGIMSAVKLSDIITKYEDSSSGEFSEWIEKLELVAKLQKITDLVSFVPLFLAGSAFAVFKQIQETDKNDYEKLKAALLLAFGVNCYSAYEQLQKRVLQDGESADVYLADIRRLVALIGQTDADPIVKCAFMAGLPVDIGLQLKAMASVEALSVSELVTRARMMLSTRSVDMACAAGFTGKWKTGCFSCGSANHFSRDCPNKPIRKQRSCYGCGQVGHLIRQCPNKKSESLEQGNENGGASAPDASLQRQ
jgi:hypothetical protein